MNKESGSVKTEDKESYLTSGYQEKNLGNLLSKLDEKILILEKEIKDFRDRKSLDIELSHHESPCPEVGKGSNELELKMSSFEAHEGSDEETTSFLNPEECKQRDVGEIGNGNEGIRSNESLFNDTLAGRFYDPGRFI